MNNAELAHQWASRQKESGKASNFSFAYGEIYSFGWWPIAKWHYGIDGTPYIIMTSLSYSSRTGRHISHVTNAIPNDVLVFYTDRQSGWHRKSPDLTPENAMAYLLDRVANLYDSCFKASPYRNHYLSPEVMRRDVSSFVLAAERLCELSGLEWNQDFDKYRISDLEFRIMERIAAPVKEKVKERELRRIEKENAIKKAHQEALAKYGMTPMDAAKAWMHGEIGISEDIDLPEDNEYRKLTGRESIRQDMETAMRIEGDQIVTNRHARVPVREAKILWERMKAGKPVHGERVGLYTVTSWNGELVIGCHHIPREIVEYFVEYYNW